MNPVSVQCRQLRVAYGPTEVLKDLSLDVEPGEFFALLGPSGSGKSTLLRLIAGFTPHQAGTVLIAGADMTRLPPWQRNVGLVFQNYALWPHLTVWDNVAFGLVERRMDKASIARKVGAALELVGLEGYGPRRPNQLSGGQQQRVALARTLVIEPQVLLLDEPLSNLDKTLRVQMRQELLALQRRLGLTTIFVTHDQEEAMTTADRMAVLDQGLLQQVGSPTQLYDEPANAFVAGFVGTMNLLPARLRGQQGAMLTLEVDGLGPLQLAAPEAFSASLALSLSFRPQALQFAGVGTSVPPGSLALTGTVQSSEFLGEFTRYHVKAGEHRLVVDRLHRAGLERLAEGSALSLLLDMAQVRLLAARCALSAER